MSILEVYVSIRSSKCMYGSLQKYVSKSMLRPGPVTQKDVAIRQISGNGNLNIHGK